MAMTETSTTLLIDGRPETAIPVSDRGFLYGHGLFETMRLWQGELPLLEFHLTRLIAGAKTLSIKFDQEELRNQLKNALSHFPVQGLVKLILTAGDSARGYRHDSSARNSKSRCLIQYFELPTRVEYAKLHVCQYRLPHNSKLAGIKHLNRLDQVMAAAEIPANYDGLVLDQADNIIEALSSNILLRCGKQWLTPSLAWSGVAGVMRELLALSIMPAMDMELLVQDIDIAMLNSADEVFICNAVTGITLISEIVGLADTPPLSKLSLNSHPQTELIRAQLAEQYPCFGE